MQTAAGDRPVIPLPPSWPRWAARGSLIAAFVCFAMNCVFMQLTSERPVEETRLANGIVGASSLAVVLGGLIAGGWALVAALRSGGRETAVIAGLGLFLNSGIVLLTLWMLYAIRTAAP